MGEGQAVVHDDDQVHNCIPQAKLCGRPGRRGLEVRLQEKGVPTAKGNPGGPSRVSPHVRTGRSLRCQGNLKNARIILLNDVYLFILVYELKIKSFCILTMQSTSVIATWPTSCTLKKNTSQCI